MLIEDFDLPKKWLVKWRLVALIAMLMLFLTGCGEPFLSTLKPAGEVAKMEYDFMMLSTLIMVESFLWYPLFL